jgi:hypothetical protein
MQDHGKIVVENPHQALCGIMEKLQHKPTSSTMTQDHRKIDAQKPTSSTRKTSKGAKGREFTTNPCAFLLEKSSIATNAVQVIRLWTRSAATIM